MPPPTSDRPPAFDTAPNKAPHGARLAEVDALRGVAALAVVLFHYTTRFGQLYPDIPQTTWQVPYGHYGVNLFFIISGFVIFMTLDRAQTAADFVVSRFSRLYPAYWACMALTFFITHALGLPGKLVDGSAALGNVLMFHNLFRIPHVDGVYWTLEVELLFYGWMLLLFMLRRLDQVFLAVGALLVLRLTYWSLARWAGIDLPWIAWRLLILEHLPWFALGLSTHALLAPDTGRRRLKAALLALGALLTLAVTAAPVMAPLALVLFALVYGAARGRLPLLKWRLLVWLGSISYPLYLLHENIGWAVLRRLHVLGWPPALSLVAVLAGALLLSHVVSRTVEQPVMHWVRRRWKQRRAAAAPV